MGVEFLHGVEKLRPCWWEFPSKQIRVYRRLFGRLDYILHNFSKIENLPLGFFVFLETFELSFSR